MQRRFKPPYEDSTNGKRTARGFPHDFIADDKAFDECRDDAGRIDQENDLSL